MRVRKDLCAFAKIYARSQRFMRVRKDLCAFAKIYARLRNHNKSKRSPSSLGDPPIQSYLTSVPCVQSASPRFKPPRASISLMISL
ncbi:hypothetical protein EV282_3445 [Fictibacillus sp. BK138]|nr:hypothetical protein EV282_3445 [Fictibacillus sp. BK138]